MEPWDENTPNDLSDIGFLDDEIRSLKRAISERFNVEHAFDTGIHAIGSARVRYGPLSERPGPGVAGRIYIATDTEPPNTLSFDNGTAWNDLGATQVTNATNSDHAAVADSASTGPAASLGFFYPYGYLSCQADSPVLLRDKSSSDDNAWLTVHPTGQPGHVLWTALDAVPTGAKAVLLTVSMHVAHPTGSTGTLCHPSWISVTFKDLVSGNVSIEFVLETFPYYNGGNTTLKEHPVRLRDRFQVRVPLDDYRSFGMLWEKYVTGSPHLEMNIYLEGWYK